MEVSLACDTATVSILDASYAEVVTFEDVPVIGDSGFCTNDESGEFEDFNFTGSHGGNLN